MRRPARTCCTRRGCATSPRCARWSGRVKRPFNVVTGWLDPDITAAQLADAGAKRISVGGALSRLALAAFLDAARAMRETGSFGWMREMASIGELRRMFAG